MINGPVVGGFLIAFVLAASSLFVGTWFRSSVTFTDAQSLDTARTIRPTICSFRSTESGAKISGTIRTRDGFIRFDIKNAPDNSDAFEWGMEIDMNNPNRMMSHASADQPFVSLDDYPDVRVKAIEELKAIMQSDTLHCAPWWSASSFRFELQGRL